MKAKRPMKNRTYSFATTSTLTRPSLVLLILTVTLCAFVPHAHAAPKRLFVCNLLNNSVEAFDKAGAFKKVFVSPGSGGLDQPQNSAVGPDGNLYVTSWGTSSVKR